MPGPEEVPLPKSGLAQFRKVLLSKVFENPTFEIFLVFMVMTDVSIVSTLFALDAVIDHPEGWHFGKGFHLVYNFRKHQLFYTGDPGEAEEEEGEGEKKKEGGSEKEPAKPEGGENKSEAAKAAAVELRPKEKDASEVDAARAASWSSFLEIPTSKQESPTSRTRTGGATWVHNAEGVSSLAAKSDDVAVFSEDASLTVSSKSDSSSQRQQESVATKRNEGATISTSSTVNSAVELQERGDNSKEEADKKPGADGKPDAETLPQPSQGPNAQVLKRNEHNENHLTFADLETFQKYRERLEMAGKIVILFFMIELVLHVFAAGFQEHFCEGGVLKILGHFLDGVVVPLSFAQEWFLEEEFSGRDMLVCVRLWRLLKILVGQYVISLETEEAEEIRAEQEREIFDNFLEKEMKGGKELCEKFEKFRNDEKAGRNV
ncbi:unnamed protein product [Amoebophrya sp. A120]|nr:unnamed protein product [Amoebophrya sp. A120]|eukprot:GSA120T00019135001.1